MSKKAVLFIIFNRPETTKKVFSAIREYRPERRIGIFIRD